MLYGSGSYFLFASKNLLDWTDLKESIPDCYECPDMFQLPVDGDLAQQKWVLVRGNGRYSIGEFDGAEVHAGDDTTALRSWARTSTPRSPGATSPASQAGGCRLPGCGTASTPTCPSTSR